MPEFTYEEWFALQQLLARYVDAVDRHDPAAFESCWTSEVKAEDGTGVSRQSLVEQVINVWKNRPRSQKFRHWITNVFVVERKGDQARLRVGIAWVTFSGDRNVIEGHYMYDDIVERDGSGWRFLSRRIADYPFVIEPAGD